MKRLLSLLVVILLGVYASAQEYVLDSLLRVHPGLVKQEANTLYYAEDSPAFHHFFTQLDSVYQGKKEKLHIMHIGGSHIQADFYSNKLRTYLQNMNEVATSQRGFVFPYHLAHTNNPLNYRVEANNDLWEGYRCSVSSHETTWGLAGVTAAFREAVDTITIRSNYKNDDLRTRYCFNRLRIFYDTWTDDYQVRVIDSSLVLSDSLVDRGKFREFRFGGDLEEISIEVRRSEGAGKDSEFLLMGLEMMNDEPGIEYTSIGANGAKFDSYFRCELFEEQLSLYRPDLFIVSIGTNDAYTPNFKPEKYERQYEEFIEMVQRVNPDCALLLTVPNDSYYKRRYPNRNTEQQQQIIHKLARKHQMAVWDFYEIMGGLGASGQWYENELMPKDRIHFTLFGYSVKADLLLDALVKQWEHFTSRPVNSILTHFKAIGE
ncbi:GDSL-type esterase/lipase family protein [Robertkochia flava]|uniref:GDSL-type esterase/lipase family protein n=1 Tax=Robertkochia flava TaxID=3447986 RepID=UPI001CCF56EC|nr:GDSL-type esterase/lipase family protein [Robertkochia marina]